MNVNLVQEDVIAQPTTRISRQTSPYNIMRQGVLKNDGQIFAPL